MIDLKNKNALVTGGSAGLGASISKQLAAEGVNLAINYSSSKERAEALAADLRDQYKVKVVVIQADVFGGAATVDKLVEDAHSQLGGLDIVISNAGWTKYITYDRLDELDDEVWDKCFQANIKTHFYLFRAAKKIFDANLESGTFIVTSSLAGRIVYGSSMPYAVSKAGLIHLVRFLAQALSVRVHAVCPGILLTEWGKLFPPERNERAIERSPIKKLADVDETAAEFVFLCKLSTSTGTTVGIDGGLLA